MVDSAGNVIVATWAASDAIACAAGKPRHAKVRDGTTSREIGAHTAPRDRIVGIAGTRVSVVTVDGRIAAVAGGGITEVLGPLAPIAAVLRHSLAGYGPIGSHDASVAGGAEAPVVAGNAGQGRHSDASAVFVAAVRAGAAVSVIAIGTGMLRLAGAEALRPERRIARVVGRAGAPVVASGALGQVDMFADRDIRIPRPAAVEGARILIVAADAIVPAGSGRSVTRVNRTRVEIVAIRAA
jgi:hypothetical protein